MDFPKTPPELIEQFAALVPADPDVVSKKMFGYPVRFINGNMFTGMHGEHMILRLPEREREAFLAETDSAIFEPMPGHRMKEYVVVPPKLMNDGLRDWLETSMSYVRSMPPKLPKAKKKK